MDQRAFLSTATVPVVIIKAMKKAKLLRMSSKLLRHRTTEKAPAMVVCKIQKIRNPLACPIRYGDVMCWAFQRVREQKAGSA